MVGVLEGACINGRDRRLGVLQGGSVNSGHTATCDCPDWDCMSLIENERCAAFDRARSVGTYVLDLFYIRLWEVDFIDKIVLGRCALPSSAREILDTLSGQGVVLKWRVAVPGP